MFRSALLMRVLQQTAWRTVVVHAPGCGCLTVELLTARKPKDAQDTGTEQRHGFSNAAPNFLTMALLISIFWSTNLIALTSITIIATHVPGKVVKC